MNMAIEQVDGVSVVHVGEVRLASPVLGDFATAVASLLAAGNRQILLDLAPVTYVDSAAIGCLMDLYRRTSNAGGQLKLCGIQKRVDTMLRMTGAHTFIEIHADQPAAIKSFEG